MLAGSISSLTAMTIFPQLDCNVAVPCSARQTSLRGVPSSSCTEDDGAQVGQPLVHHHAARALDPQALAQVASERAARRRPS